MATANQPVEPLRNQVMTTILLVDDQPLCREPIAQVLRRRGYRVLVSSDGEHATGLLRDAASNGKLPDLILLDVDMPGMDGLTLLRIVRRNPDYKHIPVIMLTGDANPRIVMEAANRNIQGYLLKHEMMIETIVERIGACLPKV